MAIAQMLNYLLVGLLFFQLASAANHTVGGPSGGWDIVTDQQTWASSHSFHIGDNLIFQYSSSHDVTEVTKGDYDSCKASNPIHSYTDGSTVIPLTTPGKRYFICSSFGHCSGGMKLAVNTLASTSAVPAASPAESPVESPAASPTASAPVDSPSVAPAFTPVPVPAPEIFDASPSESPVPEVTLPSPSESPTSVTTGTVPSIPDSDSPTSSTPLTRTTSSDLPTSAASQDSFPAGFGKAMIFVAVMLMAL